MTRPARPRTSAPASAWELSGWEQAVLTPPWLAICLVLVGWGPDHGLLERVLPFGLWALAHGPLYLGGRPLRSDARAVARASLAPPKEACVTQRARIEATTC